MIDFDQFETLAHPDGFDLNSKPLLIADGRSIDLDDLPRKVRAKGVCIARLRAEDLPQVCERLSTTALYLHRVHTTDFAALESISRLRALEVYGNPKDADFTTLPNLQLLKLFGNQKQLDLQFLVNQTELRFLSISGGFSGLTKVDSLQPVSSLPKLTELKLQAIRVTAKSQLRPLAACRRLKKLTLSNTFETAEYAYLSVNLPRVECDMFAPYVAAEFDADDDRDVMVVGRRKPFLNSRTDAARLLKYADRFKELQEASRP